MRICLYLVLGLLACDDAQYGSGVRSAGDDVGGDDVGGDDVSSDADPTDVAMDTGPDSDGEPDAPVDAGPPGLCDLTIETEMGEGSCSIDVRSMQGCDELARCLCAVSQSDDIERCVAHTTIPRGAITLADYCGLPGAPVELSVLDLVEQEPLGWDTGGPVQVEASPECGEIAAFSMWGMTPSWNLSWMPNTREVPSAPWSLADIDLDPVPLLRLDNVRSYERATATVIVDGGRLGDATPNASPRPGLFVVHTDDSALMAGLFWTYVLSSLPPDGAPVIFYEQLNEDAYGAVRFYNHPGMSPARPMPGYAEVHDAQIASLGRLLDANCLSSCGCPRGRACRDGVCSAVARCAADPDCCLGTCVGGTCQ